MAWQLDPAHTSLQFGVKHMMVSTVKGTFRDFTVDADVDEADLSRSRATITIDTASVDTGAADRDAHLRSADFFDAERYPRITFATRRLEPRGDGEYRIVGDLTIKDVTREVVFEGEVAGPIEDPWGNAKIGVSAETKVNRKDFGLEFHVPLNAGGVLVGDTVRLSLDAELTKSA
ncbi:MAG: polyisoprenoid-binding protein [Dehalococcoidia bacterium]|nr:polyisoprenoid-binding protein [Dehalococcoidia bacterium]